MKRAKFDWTSMGIYFVSAFVLILLLNGLGYELPWYAMILLYIIIFIAVDIFMNMVRRDREKKTKQEKE